MAVKYYKSRIIPVGDIRVFNEGCFFRSRCILGLEIIENLARVMTDLNFHLFSNFTTFQKPRS